MAEQQIEADVDDFLVEPRGANMQEWIATFEAHFADRAPQAMDVIQERAIALLRAGMHPEDIGRAMKLPLDLLAMMMIADIQMNRARITPMFAGLAIPRVPPEEKFRADVFAAFDVISGRAMLH